MSTAPEARLLGTAGQIEWAEKIKTRVNAEFDRVAETLEAVACRQSIQDGLDTRAIIAILEEKRFEVLGRNEARYFINNWQELTDQVQKLVRDDSRYRGIRLAKAARTKTLQNLGKTFTDSQATQQNEIRFDVFRQRALRDRVIDKPAHEIEFANQVGWKPAASA